MRDGEKFNIRINTQKDCYAYVLVEDSEKNLVILLNRYMPADESYTTGDITLMQPGGAETFFVVMSSVEQKALHDAINNYNQNKGISTANDLNNAIRAGRREASRFRENPSIPRSMGGAIRGEDPQEMGIEYSGTPVYVKTIVINH